METVDLLSVAKECVERQKLNARRAYISLNCLGESALVHGNRALLDELCQNLCDNAIRYNKENGSVTVRVYRENGRAVLQVQDTGIGIPQECQERIFERFYRVDKSHSREIGGTGLGLAITRSSIAMHHGIIKVSSKEGEGTTFTVKIPLSYIPS